jgi:hypothetical protein
LKIKIEQMKKLFSYLFALLLISINWSCDKDDNDSNTIIIEGISIVDITALNGGEAWDSTPEGLTSGPDVYWAISGGQNISSSTWFTDVSGDEVIFTGSDFPIELTDNGQTYTLNVFNKNNLDETDSGEDDELMYSADLAIVRTPSCPEGYELVLIGIWFGGNEYACYSEEFGYL